MKFYKDDGKKSIDGNSPIKIDIKIALKEIDKFPIAKDDDNYFIGFINDKNITLQFIRFEKEIWLIDSPILKDGEFSGNSLQNNNLTTEKVKKIVKSFFFGKNWKSICKLKKV